MKLNTEGGANLQEVVGGVSKEPSQKLTPEQASAKYDIAPPAVDIDLSNKITSAPKVEKVITTPQAPAVANESISRAEEGLTKKETTANNEAIGKIAAKFAPWLRKNSKSGMDIEPLTPSELRTRLGERLDDEWRDGGKPALAVGGLGVAITSLVGVATAVGSPFGAPALLAAGLCWSWWYHSGSRCW